MLKSNSAIKMSGYCWAAVMATAATICAGVLGANFEIRILANLIVLVVVFLAFMKGSVLSNPFESLIVIWCVPFSAHYSQLIRFGHPWPESPMLYLAGFLCCYAVGFHLPLFKRLASKGINKTNLHFLRGGKEIQERTRLFDMLALIGAISAVAAVKAGLNYAGAADLDMSTLREEYVAGVGVSVWSYIVLLTKPAGVIVFVVALLYQERLCTWRRIAYLLIGLSTVTSAVLSAGRYNAVQVLILAFICSAMRRAAGLRVLGDVFMRITGFAMVIALAAYMMILPYFRDRTATSGMGVFALIVLGYEPEERISAWLENLGDTESDAVYGTYIYLESPLECFRIFESVYEGSPHYGAYQLGVFSRQLARVFPGIETDDEVRKDLDLEFIKVNEAPTMWATMVRDCVLDFGWTGGLLFALGLGLYGRYLYLRAYFRPSLAFSIELAGICFISVHSIMYSAFGSLDIIALLVFGVMVQLIDRLRVACKPVPVKGYAV
jgi:oligosaccharide repeat unit polymerase